MTPEERNRVRATVRRSETQRSRYGLPHAAPRGVGGVGTWGRIMWCYQDAIDTPTSHPEWPVTSEYHVWVQKSTGTLGSLVSDGSGAVLAYNTLWAIKGQEVLMIQTPDCIPEWTILFLPVTRCIPGATGSPTTIASNTLAPYQIDNTPVNCRGEAPS